MANKLYTLLFCTVDGKLLTEEASITVNMQSASQPVNTVAQGYAGESPGAATVDIQVENAVPAADFEFDPGTKIQNLEEVEMGILGPGGKVLTAKGFIISASVSHSVGAESKLSFSFRGGFSKFE